jgi:hypothetical protein
MDNKELKSRVQWAGTPELIRRFLPESWNWLQMAGLLALFSWSGLPIPVTEQWR